MKSKKIGKLLYSEKWDLITRCYEIDQEYKSKTEDKIIRTDEQPKEAPRTTDFFSSILLLREQIKKSAILCELYARYPETLQGLKLEDLIFTGLKVNR